MTPDCLRDFRPSSQQCSISQGDRSQAFRSIWRPLGHTLRGVTNFQTEVARVIRGMLAEQHVTQTKLGTKLGKAQSYVSVRNSGQRPWTTAEMDVIASQLRLEPVDFLRELTRRLSAAKRARDYDVEFDALSPDEPGRGQQPQGSGKRQSRGRRR